MSKKVKVSKEEFVEFLLHWVAMHLSRKGIKQDAKALDMMKKGKEMFGLNLSKREELSKLLLELVALNLWIVVAVCESKFRDAEHRNYCLDIFHRRFFDQFLKETVEDYEQWLELLNVKYGEYREAIKKGTDMNLMALGELVQNNLHGERYADATRNLQIVIYVGEGMKALGAALDELEVE
ncbi:MAG: hypothetical protein R6V59_06300 [Dehalococcoidia bacterium]